MTVLAPCTLMPLLLLPSPVEPVPVVPSQHYTMGGIDTDVDGATPMPGLYAAGRTACGVVRRAEGYSSGMSVGDATFSGRMAGKQVATAPRRD